MSEKITYRDAGVDIDAGNEAVARIVNILGGSPRTVAGGEEVGGIGGFSGLYRPFLKEMDDPLLVASTDGVGTKLLLTLEHRKLDGVGQDLVAMCVNDLVVCGARPLFFLDYIATAKLDPDEIETIVGSIQKACVESDCLLIGGECAEMPGMYAPGHTDLAGFTVGAVDRSNVIDGSAVAAGDVIIGLASSGLHSNGFSLVRKVIDKAGWSADEILDGCDRPLIDTVLEPTKLYVKPILELMDKIGVGENGIKSCSHITGGGFVENIKRVIPGDLTAKIYTSRWKRHAIFDHIMKVAGIDFAELHRTFNCGIGFVVVVPPEKTSEAIEILNGSGENAIEIGIIEPMTMGVPVLLEES